MSVQNTGELTLTQVGANTNASSYLSTDCGVNVTLAPGQAVSCTLLATASQDDYDAGSLLLGVASVASHLGPSTLNLDGTKSYSSSISLNHSASLDLVVSATGAATKAGDTVEYSITASNTGAVRLRQVAVVAPGWANVTGCVPSLPGPWVLGPHERVVCRASYTFSQDVYEAGTLSFVAGATAAELNSTIVSSEPATISPSYAAGLDVQVEACTLPSAAREWLGTCGAVCTWDLVGTHNLSCARPGFLHCFVGWVSHGEVIMPAQLTPYRARCCMLLHLLPLLAAAGVIRCNVSLLNTGSVRLTNIQVRGPENNCSALSVLLPGQRVSDSCVVQRTVDQAAFDSSEANGTTLSLPVDVSAKPFVPSVIVEMATPAAAATNLALPVVRKLSASGNINMQQVNQTGVWHIGQDPGASC